MKCDYCKKEIKKTEQYGVLGSGLTHHLDCYEKAFRGKGWKSYKFRVKNRFLYSYTKFVFTFYFYFEPIFEWFINKVRR